MYCSKIIILLSIFSLFACKNSSPTETTTPKQPTIQTQAKSEEERQAPPVEEISINTEKEAPSTTTAKEEVTKITTTFS